MIRIFNPSKLTAQPFFRALVHYIDCHEDVILRQIKKEFPAETQLDRKIEDYIRSGYILRENKRYRLAFPFLENIEQAVLDQEVFVRDDSPIYSQLQGLRFQTEIRNGTNAVIIKEFTSFSRDELTLSNYFYKLRKGYSLSSIQKKLYVILGDVNPEYALKYMTNFLLKYLRKEEIVQKRPDIFVDSLVLLGYLQQNENGKYILNMEFDKETLVFKARGSEENGRKNF